MAKGTRFGREAQEAAWQSAEVDALYRLAAAGVRVPQPFNFHDGVLLMELVVDAERRRGAAAERRRFHGRGGARPPRDADRRGRAHAAAGVIHGDLSEFNILLAADGPVIIDLPQAVDAAGNNHAQRMLLRDVENLRIFFGRFAPELLATHSAPRSGRSTRAALRPDTPLTGRFEDTRACRSTSPACCAWSTMRAPKRKRGCCACKARCRLRS